MERRQETELSRAGLVRELNAIAQDHQLMGRTQNDLFTLWFLMVRATNDNVDKAREALTGVRGDRGADAVFLDHESHIAYVIQAKLRDTVMHKSEDRDVVNSFVGYARVLWGSRDGLSTYCDAEHMDEHAAEKLEKVRARITTDRRYALQLCFVTLGKFSSGVRRSAGLRVSGTNTATKLDLVDGKQVMFLLDNYLDGVVHVPPLELRIAPGAPMTAGMLKRAESRLESRVLTMSAEDVAGLLEQT